MYSSPDLIYPEDTRRGCEPSWTRDEQYINEEHVSLVSLAGPAERTGVSDYKLYEIGFYSGSAILEIGVSDGKSAAVMLKGAGARLDHSAPPVYFGICYSQEALCRAAETLHSEGLIQNCMLFQGDVRHFIDVFRLSASAIVINDISAFSEVCQALITLSAFCPRGIPVFFQRYETEEGRVDHCGIKIAIELCEGQDLIEPAGWFGGAALYQTGPTFDGDAKPFPFDDFKNCQRVLAERYDYCPLLKEEFL